MTRIVEYCGIRGVAGLTWELAQAAIIEEQYSSRRIMARIKRSLAAPPAAVIAWADRKAALNSSKMVGLPALSAIVCALLPEDIVDRVVLVAVAEPDTALFTTFVLAGGKPVLGTEIISRDIAALLAVIGDTITNGGIEMIAASPAIEGLDGINLPVFELVQTDLDPRNFAGAVAGRAPLRSAIIASSATVVMLTTALAFGDDLKDIFGTPKQENRIVIPRVPDWNAFVVGCLAAHAQEWPSVPGWRSQSRGCRIISADQPGVAWRTFGLESGRNLIIAQRVAELMYRDWPSRMTITNATIATETDIALQWSDAPVAPAAESPASIARQAEDAFVGIERSISQEGTDAETQILVWSDAALPDVLARTARLTDFWIDSIEASERGTELRLRNAPQPNLLAGTIK